MRIKGINDMTLPDVEAAVGNGAKFVYFEFCISLLIVTFRRSSTIYFIKTSKDRWLLTAYYNLVTFVLGWWGLPWGLAYTPLALFRNTIGGHNLTPQIMAYLRSNGGMMPAAEFQTADERAGKPLSVTAAAMAATAPATAVEPAAAIAAEIEQERPAVPEKRNPRDVIATGSNLHQEQIDELYDAVEREDIDRSAGIIDAMARAQNVAAVEPLIALLEYPDDRIRTHAALALGDLKAKPAVEPLAALLNDPVTNVKNTAASSLRNIGGEDAEAALKQAGHKGIWGLPR